MIIDKLGDKPKREQLDEHSFFVGVHENEEGKETVVLYPQSEVLKTSESARKYAVESKEAAENAIETGKEIIYQSTKATGANVDIPTEVFKYASITVIEGCAKAEDKRLEPSGINIISNGNSYSMPEQITSLKNYGYGAGEGYNNTVDFENGKYTQRCAVFEPLSVNHHYYAYFQGLTFDFPISRYDECVKAIETVKCSHSELTFSYYEVTKTEEDTISSGMLSVKLNGNYPTVEELQSFIDAQRTAGTPVIICYGLPDPIETDITDIVSKIDLIVTPSGIVTFDGAVGTLEMFVPKDFASKKYVKSTFAPALRGKLFGASVSTDDVSPLPHELDVKVSSKNIFPNSYTNKGTVNSNMGGIKITYNSDGSIVCNGTVNESGLFHGAIVLDGSVVTEREAVFSTNTSGNAPSGTQIQIVVIRPDGVTSYSSNGTKLQKGTSIKEVLIAGNAGAVYDNFVFKPQLEYGTVPTEFVSPSFNTDGTKVKLYGKNLIPFPYVDGVSKKVNGVTFKVNTDRSVDYSGTATANSYFTLCQGVDFGESFGTPSTGEDSTNGTYVINRGLLYNADDLTLSIMVPKGTKAGRRIYPQIGLGTSPSEYEPYVEPIEYTVINGEIKGLKPISKGMTLFTDNADTVIDCTYNRDANKVIENLTNAIISLGGNI